MRFSKWCFYDVLFWIHCYSTKRTLFHDQNTELPDMLKIIFTLEPENETSQANSPYTRRRTSGCIVVLSNPWNWENCISRWNLPSGRTSKGPSRVNILGPRLVAQCRCPNNHKPIRRGNPLRRRDKLRYVCDYLTQARCGGTLLWLAYCIPCYGRIACFVLGT